MQQRILLLMLMIASARAFITSPLQIYAHKSADSCKVTRRCPLSVCAQAPLQESGQQLEKVFSRRGMLAAAAAGGTLFSSPHPAIAVKAGPKLDQVPEDKWASLVESGKLTKSAYNVLHNQATERPFTSALLKEKREGIFSCAVCSTPLFETKTKFDSGTGWPSFYDKLQGVELETGSMLDALQFRTEVHCSTCGGHLGHVFDDGVLWQVPTGKRYCINGVSLSFKPNLS